MQINPQNMTTEDWEAVARLLGRAFYERMPTHVQDFMHLRQQIADCWSTESLQDLLFGPLDCQYEELTVLLPEQVAQALSANLSFAPVTFTGKIV